MNKWQTGLLGVIMMASSGLAYGIDLPQSVSAPNECSYQGVEGVFRFQISPQKNEYDGMSDIVRVAFADGKTRLYELTPDGHLVRLGSDESWEEALWGVIGYLTVGGIGTGLGYILATTDFSHFLN